MSNYFSKKVYVLLFIVAIISLFLILYLIERENVNLSNSDKNSIALINKITGLEIDLKETDIILNNVRPGHRVVILQCENTSFNADQQGVFMSSNGWYHVNVYENQVKDYIKKYMGSFKPFMVNYSADNIRYDWLYLELSHDHTLCLVDTNLRIVLFYWLPNY